MRKRYKILVGYLSSV